MKLVSLGVELEGGITENGVDFLRKKYKQNFELTFDGSVYVPSSQPDWLSDAEIKFWDHDKKKVYEFIEDAFSLGLKQNDTCGNHFHFRTDNMEKAFAILSYRKVWDFVKKKYKEAFPKEKYLRRIKNKYCVFSYNELRVVSNCANFGSRYYAINLLSFFERQKTIEIRILPHADNSKELISAIEKMLEIIFSAFEIFETEVIYSKVFSFKGQSLEKNFTIEIFDKKSLVV